VKVFNIGLKKAINELVLQQAKDLWGMKDYVKTLVRTLTDNSNYGTVTVMQSNHAQYVYTQMLSLNLKSML
jgi:topoisomerase IA-like protein